MTVTAGQDDNASDDSVTLTHTAAGGEYAGTTKDLPVTVDDDETLGLVLSKSSLSVTEGATAGETYTVKLSHQPTVEVTVTVSGHTGTDLTLTGLSGTNTLTFTATSWDTTQTVTVKAGEDDNAADDSITLAHTPAGVEYAGATKDLSVTVDDDETAEVLLSESSLGVDEGDTAGDTYTVKLSHAPTEAVTVTVTGQADTDLTITGLSDSNTLTSTTTSWDTAQTVTVKAGEDDNAADDSITLAHTAAGVEYAGATKDLSVTVDEDETLSVVLNKSSLTVGEGDTTGQTYTVKLSHQPTVEVTVTVSGHSGTDLTLTGLGTGSTLTFTTTDWETAQTVTVKAGEDSDAGNDSATLTHTAVGGEYTDAAAELAVTDDDDETLGLVLSESSLSVDEGDTTGEAYTVKLSDQPTVSVTVTVTGQAETDLTLTGLSGANTLTFTADDWDTAQTVTVAAAQDDDAIDEAVTLTHTAAGGEYEGVTKDLPVKVDDDETL